VSLIDEEFRVEDRGYRDSVTKIEPYGVDHIPLEERNGKLNTQVTVWFSGNLLVTTILLGFYPVFYGLSLWQSLTAVIVGSLLGSVMMGYLSAMGARLGVATQILGRGPLGYFGNHIPVAVVNVFASVGWAASTLVFGALALASATGLPYWVCAVAIGLGHGTLGVFGYNMIHWCNRWATLIIGTLFVIITILALGKADTSIGVNPEADLWIGEVGGWISAAGLFFAYLLTWAPFASDYSRYLPPEIPMRKVAVATGVGNFVALAWLGCLGVLVASVVGSLGPIEGLRELTGSFATVALLTVGIAAIPASALNSYGGSLSLLTLRIPISRQVAAGLVSIAAVIIGLLIKDNPYGPFYEFVLLTGYLIAPYVTAIAIDYWVYKRGTPERLAELFDRSRIIEWGFVAWLVGCLASVPFWIWTRYTGPFAEEFPGAGDLTYYVGATVTALVGLAFLRARPLSTLLGRSSEAIVAEEERERETIPS
jgi:NCS1 family nucleobase:cation symporter-1